MKLNIEKLTSDPRWKHLNAGEVYKLLTAWVKLRRDTADVAACLGSEPEGVAEELFWHLARCAYYKRTGRWLENDGTVAAA